MHAMSALFLIAFCMAIFDHNAEARSCSSPTVGKKIVKRHVHKNDDLNHTVSHISMFHLFIWLFNAVHVAICN